MTNGWIVDKSSDDSRHGYLLKSDAPSSALQFRVGNGTSRATVSASITTGQWYHVVATYDGSQIVLYLNGILSNASAPMI